MGTMKGWGTRRRTKAQQEEFIISKAYEYSERLHELLAEWRKGQKEGRWTDTTQPARDAEQS